MIIGKGINRFQVKTKLIDSLERWEDRTPIDIYVIGEHPYNAYVAFLDYCTENGVETKEIKEIRINHFGYSQGHYYGG